MEATRSFSLAAAGVKAVEDIQELQGRWDLEQVSLHGNELSAISGLDCYSRLRSLNLSANVLTSISGLDRLTALTALDLSSNRLQTLQGLGTLSSLQRLSLAHNFLSSLEPLGSQQGPAGCLAYLNVKNNRLTDLEQLGYLGGCTQLQELVVSGGEPGNSLSHLPDLRAAVAFALPQLQTLDGCSLTQDRAQHAGAAQRLAAARLAAFEPQQWPPWQIEGCCPCTPCTQASCAAADGQAPNGLSNNALDAVVARLAPFLSKPEPPQVLLPETTTVGCQCSDIGIAPASRPVCTQTEPHPLVAELQRLQQLHAQHQQQAEHQHQDLCTQLKHRQAEHAALQQQLEAGQAAAQEAGLRHEQQVTDACRCHSRCTVDPGPARAANRVQQLLHSLDHGHSASAPPADNSETGLQSWVLIHFVHHHADRPLPPCTNSNRTLNLCCCTGLGSTCPLHFECDSLLQVAAVKQQAQAVMQRLIRDAQAGKALIAEGADKVQPRHV